MVQYSRPRSPENPPSVFLQRMQRFEAFRLQHPNASLVEFDAMERDTRPEAPSPKGYAHCPDHFKLPGWDQSGRSVMP